MMTNEDNAHPGVPAFEMDNLVAEPAIINSPPPVKPKSVLVTMADRYGMEPKAFEATVKSTIMPSGKSGDIRNEELAAFLLIAKEYNLNPLTKEIYAFPSRGGIQPIVSIDGWCRIINQQHELDGITFEDTFNEGKLAAVTCKIFRKDRQHPVQVTEYMDECTRPTDVWKKWPNRMLRHKALIQCARYAFGFSGIVDPDEAERIESSKQEKLVNVDQKLQEVRLQLGS